MKKVIYNGKVYLQKGKFAEAILISDGKIEKVGTTAEILAAAPKVCEKIDACGKTVLPGLNDSHQHLAFIGEWLSQCDLTKATSVAQIIEIGKKYIKDNPEKAKRGVHGIGWNQDYFTDEKRVLNKHDLDKISTEVPIVFERICGHIVTANSKAMELAEINGKTPQFDGGVFEIGADGEPNGVFNETAVYEVLKVLPEATEKEVEQMFIDGMDYAVSVGLTSVQSNDVRDNNYDVTFRVLHNLHDRGKMLVRYNHQFSFLKMDNFKKFLNGERKTGVYNDDYLTLGPLKLFKDGSLGARTGLMRKEYADEAGNFGVASLSDEQMDDLCSLAAENGIQVVTHVIGDGAIDQTVTNYERTMKNGKNDLRHALVHCQITDMPLLERIAKLDVLCMVQPIFLNYDLHVVESRVGKELASTSYAFNTLLKLGAHVAYGTDAPVETCNPFECMYSAVTRKDLNKFPDGGFYPQECVDVETAVDCYTEGSAFAEFKENVKGRIKPGYYADITIIDRDIFTIPADEIKDIKAELTMVGGQVVYTK